MNFKDVVLALGVIDDGALGNEGAGIVLEVGRGVTCFRPGDPVMGVFRGSFGPCAVTDHRMLTRVPAGWSFAQAAAVPIVFSTAFYGLVDLAGLRPGETVLVHAAAGGVGMAATQIARCLGAEVFGTASAAKQELLRANGFDDTHIASSRDTTFEPQFLDQTGGRGIDVVINSLTGVFVDASLRLLSESGRFVEMGKTDIRSPENVAATRADVEYRAFDVIEAGPERIGQMLRKVVNLFEQGELTPLPRQEWDVRRAPEAFRHMEQAKHIGKVVLTVPPARDPEGTVLVTGASGTLGALIARRLVTHHGVRHLLLVSRRGGETPGASELADDLTAVQGTVTFGQCDVADRNSLAQILETVPSAHPLTAVIHAAGIIDDGVVESLDDVRVDQVLRPKIDGAVNLHELTREIPLSTFVLFSSITATLGTPGQANYAAANAFLDALAGHRKTAGLPALSLRWGPWEQRSKMTENLSAADVNRLSQSGLNLLPTADGLELFDSAMASDHVVPAPALLDGKLLRTRQDMVPPMLRGLVRAPRRAPRVTEPTAMSTNSLEQKLAAADRDEQYSTLLELVRTHAAAVLGHSGVDMVRSDKGFKEVGFDSLTAVELRNRLKNATGIHLSATLVFDYPTPGMLAQYLREQLLPDTTADPTTVGVEQVAQLEATLNALVLDEQQRRQVTTRLETLLWKWREVRSPAAEPGEESEIASASHEEIFEMIDKEFGSD